MADRRRSEREKRLLRLAESVSDREPVDWDTEMGRAPELLGALAWLRDLQALASVHDRAGGSTGSPAGAQVPTGEAPPAGLTAWGPLQILESLGHGGFGHVYRAYEPRLDRDVALKLWNRRPGREDTGRELAEARALARVRHANLPVIHGVDEHEGWLGMWTELVRGRTLEEFLGAHGPLGAREAALVGVEICRALAAVHAAGIVHRDVKTVNVMREEGGRIVLLDFGLAIRAGASSLERAAGTPPNMAPELFRGDPATPASDLYALGVVLYRLVTGAFPYDARTPGEIAEQQTRGESIALDDRRADLPLAYVRLVDQAIHPTPEARPASAEALERALLDFLSAETPGAAPATSTAARQRLPRPLTHFVGRDEELAQCLDSLGSQRLVTLTGPGGCGKTRLAIRAAQAVAGRPGTLVGFADLSALADAETVATEAARGLDLPSSPRRDPEEHLARGIGTATALLVLDNCEHLIAAVRSLVEALLEACPGLTVLATSRSPLRVPGERLLAVPPLGLPPPDASAGAASIGRFDAVRLFVERARLVRPDFRLTDGNAAAVADICRQADGLPLVIELAAARARALTPEEISERLPNEQRLLGRGGFSTAPRHETLETAIRWTYDALPVAERRLMDALAVFAGGWALRVAARVCLEGADELEALDSITGLIEQSLVTTAPPCLGVSRYRFLETLRRFALERLRESGRHPELQRRHFDVFLELAEQAEPGLWGPEQTAWATRLEADHPNFLAALAWSRSDPERAAEHLRLAGALARFWTERGHLAVGRWALESAIEHAPADPDRPALARALLGAGTLAAYQSDHAQARAWCGSALETFRALGDRSGIARARVILGVVAHDVSDYAAAEECYRESLGLFREFGDTRGVANVLNNMGAIAWRQGRWDEARALHQEALEHAGAAKDPGIRVLSLTNLGLVVLRLGQEREAAGRMAEALGLVREHRLLRHAASCLEVAAAVLARRRESSRASRLYAAADQHRASLGARIEPAWRGAHQPMLDAIARDLGAERLRAETEAGRALGLERAIDEAERGLEVSASG